MTTSHAQAVRVAELTVTGATDAAIMASLDLTAEELRTLCKTKRYRQVEAKLADALIEAAAGRLAALAVTATATLQKLLAIPASNTRRSRSTGEDKKICDTLLAREQRVAATALLNLALKLKTAKEEEQQEKALTALLTADTDEA